jgi:Family of unknown function (DUF6263)
MRQRRLRCLLGLFVSGAIATPVVPTAVLAQLPSAPTQAAPAASPGLKLELGQSRPVEVLVVGAQPTSKLQIRPINGSKQAIDLTWQVSSQVTVGDQVIPTIAIPAMRATFATQVTDVATNGDISYGLVYRNLSVTDSNSLPPAVTASLKTQLKAIEGLQGKFVMSEFGAPKSVKMTFPEGMSPIQRSLLDQFSQSVTNLAAPLPDSPIGVGSRWRQTTSIKLNDVTVNQTATYELTSLKDNVATIKFTLAQTAGDRPVTLNSPAGAIPIQSLQSSGSGQMIWNLKEVMPRQSAIDMTVKMLIQPTKTPSGQTVPAMTSHSVIKLEMQPASTSVPTPESSRQSAPASPAFSPGAGKY